MRRRILPVLLLCAAMPACSEKMETMNTTAEVNEADVALAADNMTTVADNVASNAMDAGSNAANSGDKIARIAPTPTPLPANCRGMDATECAWIASQKAQLDSGVAAFAPPSEMVVGQAQDITLAVGSNKQDADGPTVENKIDDALGHTPTPRRTVAVKVGRYMKATLTGGAFKIESIGDDSKDLGASGFAVWQWRVTPMEKGDQTLMLKVEADAKGADGKPTQLELASKSVAIKVDVTKAQRREEQVGEAKTFIQQITDLLGGTKGLLIALAGLIGAAAAVYWAIRNFGKKPDAGAAPVQTPAAPPPPAPPPPAAP